MFWLPRRPEPEPIPAAPVVAAPLDTTGLDVCPRADCGQCVTEPLMWVARCKSYCSAACGARAAGSEPPQYAWPD